MELIFAFLAGLGLAAAAGLVLRSRALAQQAEAHRVALDAARTEAQAALDAARAEGQAALREALTAAREAHVRVEGELETARAVAARAEEAAKERGDWLELQKKEMERTWLQPCAARFCWSSPSSRGEVKSPSRSRSAHASIPPRSN